MRAWKITALWVGACALLAGASPLMAQTCTPGIPCTTYAPDKGANNTKTDSKTCDGDVMNQIHARAFMEAQRENIVNQLSIRKPDSILSYTCYDQYLAVAAKNAPPIFSEAEDKWKDIYPNWDWMRVGMSVQGKPDNYYRIERVLKVKMAMVISYRSSTA
ncbi:MAG: hypothetical protein LRZ85_07145 [Alphaproteobacteria bacterium]|nr:hypothetical protein [Alphaproteobacteria bacterium]